MHQFVFDTRALPVEDRFRVWSSGLSDFEVAPADPSVPFDAVSRVTGLGPLPISESVLPPLNFRRSLEMIRARRSDYWNLNLMLEGVLQLDADGRRFEVQPGTPVLLDLARPVRIAAPAVRSIVVVLPRNLLGAGRQGGIHGPLPPSAQSALLAAYLKALCEALPDLPDAAALPTARALCELVAACLPQRAKAKAPLIRSETLRSRVLAFVDEHLAEPLTTERLCAELGVSRSALYRALDGDGGVAELIRRLRLEAAHRMLSDRTDGRTVQQIAHAAGFGDEARFSRQFHAAFGYTAGELQRTGAVPSALPADSPDAAKAYSSAVNRLAFGPDAV
jgi:AraC-like DNA-binding protein